ncbi:MAG: hypothetical protein CRN43_02475 [Candidatus Nephrothrix sp. EaCA]|nr:MAG: hypothetical protein CRN43_02475 [Candidatus Nephrothrix sp. EaCA]
MNIVAKAHINLLVRLARADREIVPEEDKIIHEVAAGYDFDSTVLRKIMDYPEPIESLSALSESKKFEFLYTSMTLILCDDNVCEREMILYRDIAHKMGFVIKVADYICANYSLLSKDQLKQEVFTRFK